MRRQLHPLAQKDSVSLWLSLSSCLCGYPLRGSVADQNPKFIPSSIRRAGPADVA